MRILISIFVSSALLVCINAGAATATLSRSSLTSLENLTLSLEVNERVLERPDLSPLEQNFRILGSHRTLISTHSTNKTQERTRWDIILRPKHPGQIVIPPVQVGSTLTDSSAVYVSDAGPAIAGGITTPIFMNGMLDRDSVYVDGQLIYTRQLAYQGKLPDDLYITPPRVPGAQVEKLGTETSGQLEYHGENYKTLTQRYAIFTNQPGRLLIDGAALVSRTASHLNSIESDSFDVEVLPKASQSSLGIWVPAHSVSIQDDWHPPAQISPGERFLRTVTLRAVGVRSESLPRVLYTQPDDAYIELQNVSLSETDSEQGIVSTRSETVSIEPLGDGEITLPPVDINWWDVNEERTHYAGLPERRFFVDPVEMIDPSSVPSAEPIITYPNHASSESLAEWFVAGLSTLLLGLFGYLGYEYYKRQQRKQRKQQVRSQRDKRIRQTNILQQQHQAEQEAYSTLISLCRRNNAAATADQLLIWAQHFWPEHVIASSFDICDIAKNDHLEFVIIDLEQQLHQGGQFWQGDLLASTLDMLRKRRKAMPAEALFEEQETLYS